MKPVCIVFSVFLWACASNVLKPQPPPSLALQQHPNVIQINDELTVTQLSPSIFVFQSQPWDANSLLVVGKKGEAVLVDTPALPRTTLALKNWVEQRLKTKIVAVINSHYHMDASGGNQIFAQQDVPIFASALTAEKLVKNGASYRNKILEHFKEQPEIHSGFIEMRPTPPTKTFALGTRWDLSLSDITFRLIHHGPGHSPDHIFVIFPKDRVMYGGCSVRHGDSLGNIREAEDFLQWQRAIAALQSEDLGFVIPGHGFEYGRGLLDNTLKLLKSQSQSSSTNH